MNNKYLSHAIQILDSKYELDVFQDILLGKPNRVLLYADLHDHEHIELHVISNSLVSIGLDDQPSIYLTDLLKLIDYNNKYAEVSGKKEYQEYIYNSIYRFDQDIDVTFPIINHGKRYFININGFKIEKNPMIYAFFVQNLTELLIKEEEQYEKMHKDSLTKLFNKYTFDYHYGKRYLKDDFHVLYLDIDNFKKINDIYGHQIGDDVLYDFARLLGTYESEYNHFYRLGGDEFVGLFFEKPDVIKRIAKEILDKTLTINSKRNIVDLSVSIGVIQAKGRIDTVKKADDLLYKVKNSGKNNYLYRIEK